MTARRILRLSGPETEEFLQGLITNDTAGLKDGLVYAALLTPQGKFIADFFLLRDCEDILLDVAEDLAEDLARRLTMFKLRSQVTLERIELPVTRGIGPAPEGAIADPRDPTLGWRLYGQALQQGEPVDWAGLRIEARVPEMGAELVSGDSFILELGFERLKGVDFRKGCYVGQEVTARMHHKTTLRKRLVAVDVAGAVPVGTPVLMEDGREAGMLYTQSAGRGLALMRMDRAEGRLSADGVAVSVPQSERA